MDKKLSGMPLIGVTSSIDESGCQSLRCEYIEAIYNGGGVPVIIPCVEHSEILADIILRLDGVLLSGGYDISPTLYVELESPNIGHVNIVRDWCELEVIRIAVEHKIPIFGICRGIQCVNVAFGGTLYQDLATEKGLVTIVHNQSEPTVIPTHNVTFVPETRTALLMSSLELATNTHHHQAIKQLGDDLIVTGISSDGIVEAIESTKHNIVAVQFHPERMPDVGISILRRWIESVSAIQ